MKRVVCQAPKQLELVDVDAPGRAADEVLVRITRIGVCGTDLHAYLGEQAFFSYPRVLGHELAAEVVEAPDGSGFAAGDPLVVMPYLACGECVACRRGRDNCCTRMHVLGVQTDGGMQELMALPQRALLPARSLSSESAALVECLAIGAHANRRAATEAGEWVLVIGAGPIGLGVAQFAATRGARVIVADRSAERVAFWRNGLGGEHAIHVSDQEVRAAAGTSESSGEAETSLREQLADLTSGEMPTAIFDATGSAASMSAAVELLAHSGRLVLVGVSKQPLSFVHSEFHKREATLLSSRNAQREDFAEVIAALEDGSAQSTCMITHRSALDEVPARFDEWLAPGSGLIKAVIEL